MCQRPAIVAGWRLFSFSVRVRPWRAPPDQIEGLCRRSGLGQSLLESATTAVQVWFARGLYARTGLNTAHVSALLAIHKIPPFSRMCWFVRAPAGSSIYGSWTPGKGPCSSLAMPAHALSFRDPGPCSTGDLFGAVPIARE